MPLPNKYIIDFHVDEYDRYLVLEFKDASLQAHFSSFKSRTFPELMSSSSWIAKLSLSINTITDILFTVSLIVLLQRSKTGFRGSNGIITKLTVFAINTGLLTSILAIVVIITVCSHSDNVLHSTNEIVDADISVYSHLFGIVLLLQ